MLQLLKDAQVLVDVFVKLNLKDDEWGCSWCKKELSDSLVTTNNIMRKIIAKRQDAQVACRQGGKDEKLAKKNSY